MRKITFFLFFIIHSVAYSQQDTLFVEADDTYILEILVNDKVFKGKCICGMRNFRKYGKCQLYEIQINDILLRRDTSFFSEKEIAEIKYVVISNNEDIKPEMTYTVYCKNSSNAKYLIVNKVTEKRNWNLIHSSSLAYSPGLSLCYSFTFWQRVSLFFGKNKNQIQRKLKNRSKKRNRFLEYIDGR